MKFSKSVRNGFLTIFGFGQAPAIDAPALRALAEKEKVLLLAMHGLDPALPGEQVKASIGGLSSLLRDVPKDRPIVAHCS